MGICFGNFAKEAVDSRMQAPVSYPNPTLPSSPGPNVVIPRTDVGVDAQGEILPVHNLKIFSFAELKTATRNFRPDSLLGEGGFGKVYRAWVDEKSLAPTRIGFGMMVAVKKLNPDSMQGVEEWNSEVSFLGRLSHPNLVKLLGYCWEDNRELLLVYEFMPKGSLDNHLFRKVASCEPLTWGVRLKILIGAARGLAFLHSNERKIIYRDFKAANILLDANFKAKIADFGLARDGPTGEDSHVSTRIVGTHGYAAPEYLNTGHLYPTSDVYGFGVVLLEILSGLRAHDPNRPSGQQCLLDFAKTLLSDTRKMSRFMDASLGDDYPKKEAFQAGQLALRCASENPRHRPSMEEVLKDLKRIQKLTNAKERLTERSSPRCRRSPYNARHAATPRRRP